MDSRVPVTILTGFLGSGKTTLLNRILREPHGLRIAVIENEFGEVGIDGDLLLQQGKEQIIEMNNGCICCTVRGDLTRTMGDLARKRTSGDLSFDHVVIETTGLADPIPVAQTFFVEQEIHEAYLLDAVITVVDAKHAAKQLDQYREAQEQVGFADRLLISKTDLVEQPELEQLSDRLRAMNPRAVQCRVDFGETELEQIMNVRGFTLDAALAVEPHFLRHGHHHHEHSDSVASFVFRNERPLDESKFNRFMDVMIANYGQDLLRYKGVINLAGKNTRTVFQGMHALLAVEQGRPWGEDERRETTLVFIGRYLPQEVFEKGLELCAAL
jgi:G3E family GTPase